MPLGVKGREKRGVGGERVGRGQIRALMAGVGMGVRKGEVGKGTAKC